jgi:UDP-N-acetylmuramoylalanine-D-glutamate ligase
MRCRSGAACGHVQAAAAPLQPIGTRDGIEYVNDSISTTPMASLAALDCIASRRVAILVGGYDRGLDWDRSPHAHERAPPIA